MKPVFLTLIVLYLFSCSTYEKSDIQKSKAVTFEVTKNDSLSKSSIMTSDHELSNSN